MLQATISTICAVQDELGIQDVSLLNYVVSDGSTMIATRFVRPEAEGAATLYYAEGGSFDRQHEQQQSGATADNGYTAGDADVTDDGSEDEPQTASLKPGGLSATLFKYIRLLGCKQLPATCNFI